MDPRRLRTAAKEFTQLHGSKGENNPRQCSDRNDQCSLRRHPLADIGHGWRIDDPESKVLLSLRKDILLQLALIGRRERSD